jgi:hypothetical protein
MPIFIKILPLYFLPLLALAAPANFGELIDLFVGIISLAIPVIVVLALLYFFWGLARFILNAGGGKEKEDAKNIMVWGIIGLFVMISIWGIVRVLEATFIN